MDTHIDWSWLKFKFVGHMSSYNVNGSYSNSARTITVKRDAPYTVAHEMGHALDCQWARDLGYINTTLTEVSTLTDKLSGDERIFFEHFMEFVDSISQSSDISSSYSGDVKETFARFIDKFVGWTEQIATGRAYRDRLSYNDRFTQAQFVMFARLLQEKAMLDSRRMANNTFSNAEISQSNNDNILYSLRNGAEQDVEKALSKKKYTEDVQLTQSSPSVLTSQKGVRNLPMLMKASHIRENVFSEQEAKKIGLPVNGHTHYHGLGKTLFLKVIDGLEDVTLAYRGTKNASDPSRRENYFILVSQHKDESGSVINVPVYIDAKGQYNRVFMDTNRIATVFGRDDFFDYINREIEKGNLVRIKNRSTQASELKATHASSYSKNASNIDTIPQSQIEIKKFSLEKQSARDPAIAETQKNLQQENENLKQDVSKLKELLKLQRTVTNGTKFTQSSVESAAKYLKKTVNAKGNTQELTTMLNEFYEYIASEKELTWDGVSGAAMPAVEWLQNNVKRERSEYANEVLSYIKNSRIYLDESQKKEAEYISGSYNNYRKSVIGNVIITDNADVSLDSKWQELSAVYPDLFDPDTSSTDMVSSLSDVLTKLHNMTESYLFCVSQPGYQHRCHIC